MENFDLVVVGAGSAGCIVTNQIINHSNLKVLLIEAGPNDSNPVIQVPLGYGMTFYHKKMNWNFYSSLQKNLNNREIYYPRGKVIGGSGSINAMIYARGLKTDFDNWAFSQNWSWDNIKSAYKHIELAVQSDTKKIPPYKIPVNDVSSQHHPILKHYFAASKDFEFKKNNELNSSTDNQVGNYNVNILNGYRASSAKIFLKPIKKHPNLTILTNAEVLKLYFENKKISGLKIKHKNKILNIKPNIGTILSSGSIMTPYLLMKSGVGDAAELNQLNIPLILNSPHVGKNLQDHLGLDYLYKTYKPTLNDELGTWKGRLKTVLKYLYNRQGPLSLSLNQGGGYINWNSLDPYPNIQLYFNPLTYSVSYKNKRPLLKTDKFNGFIIGYNSCRPKSLGRVTLNSPNFSDTPVIDPNFLSHEEDIHDVKCAINFSKVLANTNSIKKIRNESVTHDLLNATEEEMIDHFKSNAVSIYHPCGTCKMDEDPKKGVVSERLKVHGMENLWIADASVFPNITSGNINAPVMMLANLGSKFIIEDLKKN